MWNTKVIREQKRNEINEKPESIDDTRMINIFALYFLKFYFSGEQKKKNLF